MIDADRQFPEMMKRVQRTVSSAFPVESTNHVMEVSNLEWKKFGNDVRDNITLHKDYKMKDKTLSTDLIGDITIINKSGKVVDKKTGAVLVTLPHITNRASYIVNGNEVQTVNQLRLRPGPYTRFTSDDNTETFINAAGGGYKVIFDRRTGVIRIKSGTTFVYSYPILKALGVSDQKMQSAWGSVIFEANKKYDKREHVEKLFRTMRRFSAVPDSQDDVDLAVKDFFDSKRIDPKISKITLKKEFTSITPEMLLDASRKAVDLAKGTAEMDDTESLAFKSIHSVEDFVPEKLERAVPSIRRQIQSKMDRTPVVESLISPRMFSNPVIDWFMTSEFTRYSDQQNPIDMAGTSQLTTTMGEGGIRSMHAVSDQVRTVHPSQMGFMDPLHTPEGQKIGITGHLTIGAQKKGDSLFLTVINAKTGAQVQKSAQELEDVTVAFNDQYVFDSGKPKPIAPLIAARKAGKIQMVPVREVDFVFKDPRSFFSVASNAIPFLHNNSSNRGQMANRHIEQAVPLVNPDRPMVQARFKGDMGYDDYFGKHSNVAAPMAGTVTRVTNDLIRIKDSSGQTHDVRLHHNYPLNGGSFLTDTSVVVVGDRVTKGQVIAKNNFTKDGSLALGKNLRTALIPYKGQNFEDGVVISQGAATKLTSEHKHEMRLDLTKDMKVGLDVWLAHYPDEALKVNRGKYDTSGVIRKGSRVDRGDVLVPAVEQVRLHEEYDYARLHKALRQPWRNVAIVWESDYPGTVVDVVKTAKFIKVFVKTEEAAQIGDKVSNRAGGKGIIVNILPDNEMLQDESGQPLDVLFNPGGVAGRVNPGQMFEGAAGKVALKTGKQYLVDNFSEKSSLEMVEKDLKDANMSDLESVTDPTSNNVVKDVFVGNVHFVKLQHQVSKKFSARGIGAYTADEQPSKVSGGSAQNIGSGEIYALLASGSLHFLKDAATLKSQSNPEYWRAMQLGLPTSPTKQPFILDKFVTSLEGAGINMRREGNSLKVLPMTDKETESRSKGEIKSPDVVRASDLRPERGGLFDKAVTGGIGGTSWSHIDLETPVPNPLMEKSVISVLGLKPAEYRAIMAGNMFVTQDGKLTADHQKGQPAGVGLKILLDKVNVSQKLEETIVAIRAARGARLNELNLRRRYLQALKASKMTPSEAYIQSKIPVIPPAFRPIYPLPDGALNVADPNHSYREILMINNQLKDLSAKGVDNKNLAPLRADLFSAVQGMTGMMEPLTRSKNFKGFVSTIKGRVNKRGLFQGRVVKRPQDLSGRSTIIPDPQLGIDEMGMPAEMGLVIYKPFIMRRLVGLGYKPTEAVDLIDKKDEKAFEALRQEAKERPVYLNRAPTLHKFGIMPFHPKIMEGKAIRINPLIVRGYNADFDGDTMGVHVPVSEEARVEALSKMPSKQLFSVTDDSIIHTPTKEYVLGLYLMTKPVAPKVTAKSVSEMLDQFNEKKIRVNQSVSILGKIWTPGQALVNDVFPAGMRPGNVIVDKSKMSALIEEAARTYPKEAGAVITKLKDLGAFYVTEVGYSVGLKDLEFNYVKRDKILDDAAKRTPKMGFEAAHGQALDRLGAQVRGMKGNRFVLGNIESGAFGKADMVTQMLATPVAVRDHKNELVEVPIAKSFAEGHSITSYWSTIPGARKGLIEKGLGTAETGALSKRLMNTTIEQTISVQDCGTREGLLLPIESREAVDRVVADGRNAGKMLTQTLARQMKSAGKSQVKVRSPLTCRAQRGICAKCFGLLENGQFPPIGYHIGVLAGQAVSEPMTQLMLRCCHRHNVIVVRKSGRVGAMTLEQFWDRAGHSVIQEDGIETKPVIDIEIWDGKAWTHVQYVQRHAPDDSMVAVKAQSSGAMFISQANHPNWGKEISIICPECGSDDLQFSGRSRQDRPTKDQVWLKCNQCEASIKVHEDEYAKNQERIVFSGNLDKVLLRHDAVPASSTVEDPPVDGYAVGLLAAEGCPGFSVPRSSLEEGRKQRHTARRMPHGKFITSYTFCQYEGEVKEAARSVLSGWKEGEKSLRLYDPDFARIVTALLGHLSFNKALPPGFLGFSREWLIRFVAGMYDGDGTPLDSRIVIDTTSFALASQVFMIVRERLGGSAYIRTTKNRETTKHQAYQIHLRLPFLLPSVKKHEISVIKNTAGWEETKVYGDLEENDFGPVYDVATDSRCYSVNGIRTHNSFHTGGAMGRKMVGFDRIRQIMEMPENVPGKSTIAMTTGTVKSITQAAGGGWIVRINDVDHFIPKERGLGVKRGDRVLAGKRISTSGVVKPQELLSATGDINAVRGRLIKDLDNEFSQGGVRIKRKLFETVVKPMTDRAEVLDAGDGEKHEIFKGEILSTNLIEETNKKIKQTGGRLIKFKPTLLSIRVAPYHGGDFIGKLMFERPHETISAAPRIGAKSNIATGHPITQYVFGQLGNKK